MQLVTSTVGAPEPASIMAVLERAIGFTQMRLMSMREDLEEVGDQDDLLGHVTAFLTRLKSVSLLSDQEFGEVMRTLDPNLSAPKGSRPGRDVRFSIEVVSDRGVGTTVVHTFDDVMATNPLDAYVALSKRSTYRCIPDIQSVSVFGDMAAKRTTPFPLKLFRKQELIYV